MLFYIGWCIILVINAEVAKLADALALGASGVTHGGSSPLLGTFESNKKTELMFGLFIYLVTVIDVVD